jgi:cell volume regulation protein A
MLNLEILILGFSLILLISVFASKAIYRFGVPTLVIFLSLGIAAGSEGLLGIYFDNYGLTSVIAQIGLIIIIFSGGFDTPWTKAKKNAPIALVLSSLGVILTTLFVGLFSYFFLNLSILEALLLAAILASTDAAAVFSILRSKNLYLKSDLAATLELESGSNDPFSYLLTTIFISLLTGANFSTFNFIVVQISFGVAGGLLIGFLSVKIINSINLKIDGLYIILPLAMMLLSFSSVQTLGGNGYLSVYITGLIMGNRPLTHKISMVKFFDGLTWLAQILLFFTLGLLVFPSQVLSFFWESLGVALFITFIGRPLAVGLIMFAFKKPLKDIIFISWVGFRGVASIVFAILALNSGVPNAQFYFNVVFMVSVFSVLVQGTFLGPLAKRLNLTEEVETPLTTFTDYRGDTYTDLLKVKIASDSAIAGKKVMECNIPEEILIAFIQRGKGIVVPRGSTVIEKGDILILASDNKQELIKLSKNNQFKFIK